MSTPSSALPTRQQLEEIDALLKRMLSLPPLASEAVEPAPATPSVSPYAQPTIREVPPATPPAVGEPVVQAWRVEWPQQPVPAPAPTPAQVASPPSTSVASWGTPVGTVATIPPPVAETPRFTVYQPQSAPVMPAPVVAPTSLAPTPTPTVPPSLYGIPVAAPVDEARPLWLLPVVVVNGLYDFLTYVLGPFGPWLRDSGRRWLGLWGILMIVGSLVWLVGNWLGYDWPTIPWQKLELSRFGWTK